VPPALGIGLSLATFALFRARRFDHASRVAARALNSYLPPALARQVVNDPNLLQLGGEPRELSILFTDIAGFTSYSEASDPHEVVALLNIYLDRMAEIVLAHNGTLDKYIGDAVMAFFGAPVGIEGHSELAISCALNMDEYGRQFAVEHGLKTRIGVHTGTVIVGNIGGEQRFDYTVIGDAVNTAARLEGANKAFKATDREDRVYTTLCISGDTIAHYNSLPRDKLAGELSGINLTGDDMRRNPDGATLRRIGMIKVKGREAALNVYTFVPEEFSPENLDSYASALDFLEAGKYDEAGKILRRLYNEDDLSAFQLERCNVGEGPILTLTEK
jgi:class 3 adenylate cyclase